MLFNAKAILVEEQQLYYLIYSWDDKGDNTFLKGLNVKSIVRLDFKLTYFEAAVQL